MKMKNMTKKIASVALAVIMAVTFMPMLGDAGKAFASTGGTSIASAVNIPLGQEITGRVDNSKYTYYKFTTTANSNVRYKIWGLGYQTNDCCTQVEVIDKDGKVYVSDEGSDFVPITNSGSSATRFFSKLKESKTYYIRINIGYGSRGDFNLKISQNVPKPAKVTFSSVTAGKKKLTAKWHLIASATKYEVNYRVKGTKSWKTVTTTNTYKTIKKLKSGKTYQVKVRALRVVDGKTYKGSFSAVKSVKTKK